MTWIAPALVLGAYLIGSIPFSFIVARLVTKDDIRRRGSGNVGATNVLRNAGKLPGAIALVLDILKGIGAVMLTRYVLTLAAWPFSYEFHGEPLGADTFWIGLTAFVAVVGHMFPVWLGFHGGKGVATSTGAFLAVHPTATGFAFLAFLVAVGLTRYISLGSMIAAASMPLIIRFLVRGTFWEVVFTTLIAAVVILKHHSNIARLAAGEERKFPR